ncbi:ABC transporter ATP-binding protein [Streptomyces sp. NPDC002225]|uniref:ABC transporter ATP-binding protein n=1 Tax=Streptomyces sp. NPDC002225 TaxID=3154413 RepID=UPI003330C059
MLQAIGITSAPRRGLPAAVDDLTFEARPGRVTALLGASGSGKTTALRLMLELDPGRGVTYFRGRPLHRIPYPAREVGVVLGDVPGHPGRTARGQLRMLAAAAGVPAARADELLGLVGLADSGDRRIGTLSLGMDRRLAFASALLGDPHALVLDDPAEGLDPGESRWLHGMLRAHAARGGTVLYTTADPREAARNADRVISIGGGRLIADQEADDFSRTRLRPRVAVRSPHAARLAAAVSREARAARRSVEVVAEDGGRLAVYGSNCAEIGDIAFRHGLPVYRLADEVGDGGCKASRDGAGPPAPDRAPPDPAIPGGSAGPAGAAGGATPRGARPVARPMAPVRLAVHSGLAGGPLHPLRYELHRLLGVRTTPLIAGATLVVSVVLSLFLARSGHTPLSKVLTAWPSLLPLPPAAVGAGVLGALSYGDEFRYPALAAGRGAVQCRPGLLLAKLAVTAGGAAVLALAAALLSGEAVRLVYGPAWMHLPPDLAASAGSWVALTAGCAWAGLLAAGIFRVATAGVAAVLAVPVLVVPLVRRTLMAPDSRPVSGLPAGLRELIWPRWPYETDRWVAGALGAVAHPVGVALVLSVSVLALAYLFTGLQSRARWRSRRITHPGSAS